jgi:hypothetical protein
MFGFCKFFAICMMVAGLCSLAGAQSVKDDLGTVGHTNYSNLSGINDFLLNQPGQQPQQQDQQQERMIFVKTGRVVYCAVSGCLLHYDVNIIPIRESQYDSTKYFDDGDRGNDEVPNDGMPSSIILEKDKYISIYAYRNMERKKAWKRKMIDSGPSKFFRLSSVSMDTYAAATASTPEEREAKQRSTITYWQDKIGAYVDQVDEKLERYEGFELFKIEIPSDNAEVYYDATRSVEEVQNILDGRIKKREEATLKREMKKLQLEEQRQAKKDEKESMLYGGRSPTGTFMRAAQGAAQNMNSRNRSTNSSSNRSSSSNRRSGSSQRNNR